MDPIVARPLTPSQQRQAVAQLLVIAFQRLFPDSDQPLAESSESCTNELDVVRHQSVNAPTA